MDGKGARRDGVFVEHPWRTIEYKRVYLRAYESVNTARTNIAQFIGLCNIERTHSSLQDDTPDQTFWTLLPVLQEAA